MKKIFIGLSLALMALSCAREDCISLSNNRENDKPSTFVTPEMAIAEVENFLKDVSVESRAYVGKTISNIYATRDIESTRSGDTQDVDCEAAIQECNQFLLLLIKVLLHKVL